MFSKLDKLVHQAQRGDKLAYHSLVVRHIHQVFMSSYNMVHNYHQAEDITQETLLKSWKSLRTLEEAHKFPQWLMEITRNTARDWLKTKGRKKHESLDEVNQPMVDKQQLAPEVEKLLEEIGELPADQQEIIIMHYIHKLSYKEIAQEREITISGVGEKLWRIRQMLKDRLKGLEKKD
ncbi:RNA polymerase sigma factor [Planctomycetota bacterium]